MARAVDLIGANLCVTSIAKPEDADSKPNVMPCVACCSDEALAARDAQIDGRGGQAAYEALMAATDAALARTVDGIVTAPLNKAALWQAGHHFPGHTEMLADRCGVGEVGMMLYLAPAAFASRERGLGVVHVTLHTALRNVFDEMTGEGIVSKAQLIDRLMARLNGVRPAIGICALNPHAGEEGLFGDEEQRIIAPAVAECRTLGLNASGPLPADTLLLRARNGEFDAVVAMYHDQGHIAFKLLGMHSSVNITLGLPIIRTSVAHGTAFDLAWQKPGRADGRSMVEAIRVAARLSSP
jgi:4-hydroxythreonine-4-phosphate dehydrogenase